MLLGGAAIAWSLASVPLAGSLAAEPLPRSVLIIDQSGPGLPFYAGISSGIRAAMISGSATQVSIYHEQLDFSRFRGPVYEHSLNAHFRVKYRDKPVGVIIAVGSAALEYVLRSRAELWPEAPVVFAFVDKPAITRLTLPPDVTGNTLQSHPRDMVTVARTLVPDIKRIALWGDPPENQTYYRDLKERFQSSLLIWNLSISPVWQCPNSGSVLPFCRTTPRSFTQAFIPTARVTPSFRLMPSRSWQKRPQPANRGRFGHPLRAGHCRRFDHYKLFIRRSGCENCIAYSRWRNRCKYSHRRKRVSQTDL